MTNNLIERQSFKMMNAPAPQFFRTAYLCTAIALLFVTPLGHAQVVIPPQLDISRQRAPQLPVPTEQPRFDLKLQSTEKSAVPKSADFIEFPVRQFDIQGVTAYPAERVAEIFAPLAQGTSSLVKIREAAEQLERVYRNDGFFLTRVFVPPQSIGDGTVRIQVIEGYVGDVQFENLSAGLQQAVNARLHAVLEEKPVRLATLEDALMRINDLPSLSVQGVLKSGRELGASTLTVTRAELDDVQLLTLNNQSSTVTGPWNLGYSGQFQAPLTVLDTPHTLSVGVNGAGGGLSEVRSVNALISAPLGDSNWIAGLGGLWARAEPGGAAKPLDLVSQSSSLSARGRYALQRLRASSWFVDLGLTLNRTETTLSGITLAADQTTVGEAGLSWLGQGPLGGNSAASVQVLRGLDWFGAMDRSASNPSVIGFEPDFTKVVVNVQHTQPLAQQWSLHAQALAQLSRDKLVAGEQVAFGGANFAKGYDPSTILGDKGHGVALELRRDVSSPVEWLKGLQLYGFVDMGQTIALATPGTPESKSSLVSAGVGARMAIGQAWSVNLFYAKGQRERGVMTAVDEDRIVLSLIHRF